jgi:hypothetical protein
VRHTRQNAGLSYRKSRLVESVVVGKGLVVKERIQVSVEPQRANPPPIEL